MDARYELRSLARELSRSIGAPLESMLAALIATGLRERVARTELRAHVVEELARHRRDVRARRLAVLYDVNHPGESRADRAQ